MLKPRAAGAPSIISSDVKIVGNLTAAGELQLDGIVEGDVKCGSLTMGEHGQVAGSITADTIVVRGRVEGKIRARSVRLEKTSRICGDVWHETLSIEAGAFIEGKFVHAEGGNKRPMPKATTQDESKSSLLSGNGKPPVSSIL
ncbi:MAG: polymer-forming cytoskeletal protein [Proteobacteria bacterium]|nr:polymer-forming cytoskeletal protein [Pseudomonadota bacterium]